MKLIDTSAWIEILTGTALGRKIARLMPEPAEHVVPTLVQHELTKWLTRERGEETADQVMWIPKTDPFVLPSLAILPLQLFAYYVALLKGCDIDKPRNLAKSVTVE